MFAPGETLADGGVEPSRERRGSRCPSSRECECWRESLSSSMYDDELCACGEREGGGGAVRVRGSGGATTRVRARARECVMG